MVVVDLAGEVIEGRLKPSIDTDTHLHVYRHRSDVLGICHTHSTYCSVFASLGKPIPPCLTASAMLGGLIPLGGYVPIGGEQIGEEIVAKIGDKSAIIMQNHGVFTIGKDARRAVKMAIEVEEIARITYFALLLGKPIILTEQQVQEIWEMYNLDYGQS
jgi:L-ribulose-5-phosphate 4-epimerase